MPEDWVLCLLGAPIHEYSSLIESEQWKKKVINLGFIEYEHIEDVWKEVDATIIIYKSKKINNRYCAPNRLFLALQSGKPIIANCDNPVLANYIKTWDNGVLVNLEKIELYHFFSKYSYYKSNARKAVNTFQNQVNNAKVIKLYNPHLFLEYKN